MKKTILMAILLMTQVTPALAKTGVGTSGGGDRFVADFVRTATLELYPLLKKQQDQLKGLDIESLIAAADPERAVSEDQVFESCDGSHTGREVELCYDETTDMFHISRTKYPVDQVNSPSKWALVTHELLRRRMLESDDYRVSRRIRFEAPTENEGPIHARIALQKKTAVAEFWNTDWIHTGGSAQRLRLVLGSEGTAVANAAYVVFRKPNQGTTWETLEEPKPLFFENRTIHSPAIAVAPGYDYVVRFQGQAHGLPALVSQPQAEPFVLSARFEDEAGNVVVDFGKLPVQVTGKTPKPLAGASNAFELVETVVNPVMALINGQIYFRN